MRQRDMWLWLSMPFVVAGAATGAQAEEDAPSLKVAVTFSVLGDLVERVAGEDAEVTVLTPINAEVHEWELTPDNFAALEDADVVFYNGYQLEQWMSQVNATVDDNTPVVAVAEASGYPTQRIVTGDLEGDIDPHLWMDPRAGVAYVQAIANHLEDALPRQADEFQRRADELEASLDDLHVELQETLAAIPDERRVLLTSEAAFLYFADAYDFEHDGIWGNNAETEGSPRQLMRIIDMINDRKPAALFWESTISDRHVTSVANDTNVPVAGPLYVDSLSEPDGDAPDYFAMLRHNAALLRDHLASE